MAEKNNFTGWIAGAAVANPQPYVQDQKSTGAVDWGDFYSSISATPVSAAPKKTPLSYAPYFDPGRVSNQSIVQMGVVKSNSTDWSAFYRDVGGLPYYSADDTPAPNRGGLAPLKPLVPLGGIRPRWTEPTFTNWMDKAAYDEIDKAAPFKVPTAPAREPGFIERVGNRVLDVFTSNGRATYKIKSGDTLSEISAATGISVSQLARMNNLADPNKIVAGKNLVLNQGEPASTRNTSSGSGSGSSSGSTPLSPKAVLKPNGDGTFKTSNTKQTVSVGQKVQTPSGVKTVQANGTLK